MATAGCTNFPIVSADASVGPDGAIHFAEAKPCLVHRDNLPISVQQNDLSIQCINCRLEKTSTFTQRSFSAPDGWRDESSKATMSMASRTHREKTAMGVH